MSPPSASSARLWRTAFLTLRDETLTPRAADNASSIALLDDSILSQSRSLVSAAPHLPPHEVSSDLIFLLDLAALSCSENAFEVLVGICDMFHDVAFTVPLELTSSDWAQMLDCFTKLLEYFLLNNRLPCRVGAIDKATLSTLDVLRHLIGMHVRRISLSENIQLLKFLLNLIRCCHAELNSTYHSSDGSRKPSYAVPKWNWIWKVQTTAFWMVGEAFYRVGPVLPIEIWQSALEVLRKEADFLSSKNIFMEDSNFSRYCTSLLDCLHLVLANRRASLSGHVAAFVATLRMFLTYGSSNDKVVARQKNCNSSSPSCNPSSQGTAKARSGRYKPPHLRNRLPEQIDPQPSGTASNQHFPVVDFTLSDSDYSDNERSSDDSQRMRSRKARIAAIICLQTIVLHPPDLLRDLCEADPKAFTAQWTMLLPSNDALHPRKCETTLMACLLFDPHMKVRLAAVSAITAMLEGASSVILQVAEYKDSSRCGSYVSLSSALGQILIQLHTGILHLLKHEAHAGLVMSLFKMLTLLISSTPYSKLPPELLPMILSSLQELFVEGFRVKSDQIGLQAMALNCIATAVSASPSSTHVEVIFQDEIHTGSTFRRSGVSLLSTLFQHADRARNPVISIEALQALKAVCHNYPDSVLAHWLQVSGLVKGYLRPGAIEGSSHNGSVGIGVASSVEKVIAAAVKVLDEFLRASTGFRGTEEIDSDKVVETPFSDDLKRGKRISSAPSRGTEDSKNTSSKSYACTSGVVEWNEAIEEHLTLTLCHTSAMVRAASLTCFAGLTSAVFFSLEGKKQEFILSSCVSAAANDEVPSVRAAACRAIGVIACFPDISRSGEILQKIVNAAEINTHHHLISVRIPASWALANVCDSLRYCFDSFPGFQLNLQVVESLSRCALRLAKDGDKIKSNAVRALGNISRVLPFPSPATCNPGKVPAICHQGGQSSAANILGSSPSNFVGDLKLLNQIVQTFLSCITTGNVKVQWNVCHAISILFLNDTVQFQNMEWAPSVYSVLLVLLRDSSNFKIRIQAAAALAVPSTMLAYGRSFSDVVQGVEHVIENLGSDHSSTPSSFKYRIALEKQLTLTLLHILGLCSTSIDEPLKEFLIKKVGFLEGWLRGLCSSLREAEFQKVDLISKALQSVINIYQQRNQSAHAMRLQKLLTDLDTRINR